MRMHYKLFLPMNSMAWGKKLAKFWLQWSAMGICMYLKLPHSSNTFGKSGVTFRMYWNINIQRKKQLYYLLFSKGLVKAHGLTNLKFQHIFTILFVTRASFPRLRNLQQTILIHHHTEKLIQIITPMLRTL